MVSRHGGTRIVRKMWVYILRSINIGKFYVGYTSDLHRRLNWHNTGLTKFTKSGVPWEVVYKEFCSDKLSAIKREKQIKSYKGGNGFKKLIGGVA